MSGTGDFGPAPPGINLSENQNGVTYASVIALTIVGTCAVTLRTYARVRADFQSLALDDYLIISALVFAWGTAICTFISVPWGNGRHLWALTTEQFTVIWKILFAYVMIYATAVSLTKASIVMFYRRLFGLRKAMYFCLFFVIGWWIETMLVVPVGCRPHTFFWEQFTNPHAKGTCPDTGTYFLINGILGMLIDVLILSVPIPTIWKLQMPRSQKWAVIGILMLGSFVCVASIVRIVVLDRNINSKDATFTIAPTFIWSCVEPFVGIVCACLPTFAPFFRRCWGNRHRTTRSKRSGNSNAKDPLGSEGKDADKFSSLHTIGSVDKNKYRTKHQWGRGLPLENNIYETQAEDDDVYLTSNEIYGGPTKEGSVGSRPSDEEMGIPMQSIMVKDDVNISVAETTRTGHR